MSLETDESSFAGELQQEEAARTSTDLAAMPQSLDATAKMMQRLAARPGHNPCLTNSCITNSCITNYSHCTKFHLTKFHLTNPRLTNPRLTVGRPSPSPSSRRYIELDLGALDAKWQRAWNEKYQRRLFQHDLHLRQLPTRARAHSRILNCPRLIVPMFPYPSGSLHMGHLRVYTIADVVARYRRMKGENVALPIGWDAFGLPAENAALERGIDPYNWTTTNIAKMKSQLGRINAEWDWHRELSTCDPNFYAHTQRIFLALYRRNLVYQAEAEVNFDPVDQTVLANEQVDANGCSWRSGAKVVKKKLKQWFIRITAYQNALHDGLDKLAENDAWPKHVLEQQRHWLGKVTGYLIKFPLLAHGKETSTAVETFVEHPAILHGAQYILMSPTHPLVKSLAKTDHVLRAFIDSRDESSQDTQAVYLLPTLQALNPVTEEDTEPLRIYVGSNISEGHGFGATLGVPGHSRHDCDFWAKHAPGQPVRVATMTSKNRQWEDTNKRIAAELEEAQMARPFTRWRLRDWLISRQRYWGTPIPIVHCEICGAVPLGEYNLPVRLPRVSPMHWQQGKPVNPLHSAASWINTQCPQCERHAVRETDTMDTFVDSSWYYGRYADPNNPIRPWGPMASEKSLPIDTYIGGVEHSILHLLYTRFIYKALALTPSYSPSLDSFNESMAAEPLKRLITQGMVHGKTYIDPSNGRFLRPEEVDLSDPKDPRVLATGATAKVSFEKMSKSKHNGVDPTDCIERHGADATRAHIIFQAPVNEVLNWDETKIKGITRWLKRVFDLVHQQAEVPHVKQTPRDYLVHEWEKRQEGPAAMSWNETLTLWRRTQKTISAAKAAYDNVYSLNTVPSTLMKLTNEISSRHQANSLIKREAVCILVRLMAPMTPAFAEECWSLLHPAAGSIFEWASFPIPDGTVDMKHMGGVSQGCALYINGKYRETIEWKRPNVQIDRENMDEWVKDAVLHSSAVRERYSADPLDLRKAQSVHVAKNGALISFVVPVPGINTVYTADVMDDRANAMDRGAEDDEAKAEEAMASGKEAVKMKREVAVNMGAKAMDTGEEGAVKGGR